LSLPRLPLQKLTRPPTITFFGLWLHVPIWNRAPSSLTNSPRDSDFTTTSFSWRRHLRCLLFKPADRPLPALYDLRFFLQVVKAKVTSLKISQCLCRRPSPLFFFFFFLGMFSLLTSAFCALQLFSPPTLVLIFPESAPTRKEDFLPCPCSRRSLFHPLSPVWWPLVLHSFFDNRVALFAVLRSG